MSERTYSQALRDIGVRAYEMRWCGLDEPHERHIFAADDDSFLCYGVNGFARVDTGEAS